METAKLSSKGQVVLPRSIRASRRLKAGAEFSVEDTAEGILLRPLRPFPPTTVDEIFGCLRYPGKPKTLEEMQAAVMAEAKRQR